MPIRLALMEDVLTAGQSLHDAGAAARRIRAPRSDTGH